jgi:hypothetical protein
MHPGKDDSAQSRDTASGKPQVAYLTFSALIALNFQKIYFF